MATYKVVTAPNSKIDLATMADQCVEIVGVVAPETGTSGRPMSGAAGAVGGAAGAVGGGAAGAAQGAMHGGAQGAAQGTTQGARQGAAQGAAAAQGAMPHRAITVTTIKAVEGGCR